jgi:hypothetical protein
MLETFSNLFSYLIYQWKTFTFLKVLTLKGLIFDFNKENYLHNNTKEIIYLVRESLLTTKNLALKSNTVLSTK